MWKMLAPALTLGFYCTAHAADPDIAKIAERAMSAHSLMVGSLRDQKCGGALFASKQDAKNAEFAACVMYVLGAVDMIWEWQKIDPMHAPRVCVPRTVPAGDLIIAVQNHIETTTPWRNQQFEAAPAIIAALAAKWPCERR
jgi:Rap1a immunity proteins